jgi:uncharacterized protein
VSSSERILYGSETPIWYPPWVLDAYWDFEMPQDLVDRPRLPAPYVDGETQDPGRNLLKLSGMDVEHTKRKLAEVA